MKKVIVLLLLLTASLTAVCQSDSTVTAPADSTITGIEEIIVTSVYPMPCVEQLTIEIAQDQFVSASLIQLNGAEVKRSSTTQIQTSDLSSGIYVLKVFTRLGIVTRRVIKL